MLFATLSITVHMKTYQGLYNDLVKNAEHIISSWGRDYERRQSRMKRPLEQDEEAKIEADNEIAEVNFKRKYQHKLDIDSEFRKTQKKRFSNWEDTLKATNEVIHTNIV